MRRQEIRLLLAAAVLVTGLAVVVGACFGGGDGKTNPTQVKGSSAGRTTTVSTAQMAVVSGPADPYSTFRSKDPFIQQALPPSTTSTTQVAPTSTVSSTTTSTTATTSSTVTTSSSTTTTSFFAHLLQILSVATVEGSPAVTFQVDNTVYPTARVGDVLSTSWGQFKVLGISTESKSVTLLHGSETLILVEGQIVYE